jgi:Uma2 family endonuclease
MVVATAQKITPAEYLERENKADTKSELIEGKLFPIAGTYANHNRLTSKLNTLLSIRLDEQNYEVFVSDMRLCLQNMESYLYPDVMVVKGKPIFTDDSQMAITNPCLIAEVLSPSTATYDKKDKFDLYKSLPTLEEYLIISQTKYQVALYRRLKTNQWLLTEFSDVGDAIPLESVSLELKLGDLYQRVTF